MDQSGIAIHLRTGHDADAQTVERWLAQHHWQCIPCADAFELCTRALRQPELIPDLVLLGLDWLPPDEQAVSGHIADTWPAAIIVAYSHDARVPAGLAARAGVSSCPLQQLLRLRPADLLRRAPRGPARDELSVGEGSLTDPGQPLRPIRLTQAELAALLDDDNP